MSATVRIVRSQNVFTPLRPGDDHENEPSPLMRARSVLTTAVAAALLAGQALTAVAAAPVPSERSLYTDAPNGMFLLDQGWTTRADPDDVGEQQGWMQRTATSGFTPTSIPNAFNAGDLSISSFNGGVQWYR